TEYSTLPGPVLLLPDAIVIQSSLLTAFQVQLPSEVTLMAPVPPPFLNALPPGLIVVEQAPSCDMVTIQSAIAIVPVLGGPLLGETVNVTVPAPLSELCELMEMNCALLTTAHMQSGAADTSTDPELPPAGNDIAVAEAETEHMDDRSPYTFNCP